MIITFVGRLIEAKGVQDLIEAYCHLIFPKIHPKLELWIIGDGNYRKQLEAQAANCPSIKFLGEQSHNIVMEYLKQTDIFVNPSYSEGLPTSVLEAASLGLPIVATDVGGTREIIEHRVSGYLCSKGVDALYEALSYMCTHRGEALQMGNQARIIAKSKFGWDGITQQWILLLNRVSSGRSMYE